MRFETQSGEIITMQNIEDFHQWPGSPVTLNINIERTEIKKFSAIELYDLIVRMYCENETPGNEF